MIHQICAGTLVPSLDLSDNTVALVYYYSNYFLGNEIVFFRNI